MQRLALLVFLAAICVLTRAPLALGANDGVILYGDDYQAFPVNRGDWQRCERACDDDEQCAAWLFIKPIGQCRLKSTIGPSQPNPCCISDVKQRYRPEAADSVTGTITTLQYDSDIQGRGACIKTEPDLPRRFSNWACLWKDNSLYAEISDLLLSAYRYGDECLIRWEQQSRAKAGRAAELVELRCTRTTR